MATACFSDEEEIALVSAADARSLCHMPFTKAEFIAFARKLRPDLADRSLQSWFGWFMSRWKAKLGSSCGKGAVEGACVREDAQGHQALSQRVFQSYSLATGCRQRTSTTTTLTKPASPSTSAPQLDVRINSLRRAKHSMTGEKSDSPGSFTFRW